MGVKKNLKLTESQLALLDLLCTRPVWLTALNFAQLVEPTVLLFALECNCRVCSALRAYCVFDALEWIIRVLPQPVGLLATPPQMTSVLTFSAHSAPDGT